MPGRMRKLSVKIEYDSATSGSVAEFMRIQTDLVCVGLLNSHEFSYNSRPNLDVVLSH